MGTKSSTPRKYKKQKNTETTTKQTVATEEYCADNPDEKPPPVSSITGPDETCSTETEDHDTISTPIVKRRTKNGHSKNRVSNSSSNRHSKGSRDSRVSRRMSFYDIIDANDITSYLIVGNQPSAQDEEFLSRKKIMFVMNLSNLPLEYIKPDIVYKNIFLEDEDESDLLSVLEICLQALDEWKRKCIDTKGRILVYSYNGLSRSCSVVLAHLMTEERLTLRQAWNHLKERHPMAKPNDGFLLQLIQYEQQNFNRRLSMTIADFYGK